MDESRRFDEDFGFLAHQVALTGDGDDDERHCSGAHHRNLQKVGNALRRPSLPSTANLKHHNSTTAVDLLQVGGARPDSARPARGVPLLHRATLSNVCQHRSDLNNDAPPPRARSLLLRCRHAFSGICFHSPKRLRLRNRCWNWGFVWRSCAAGSRIAVLGGGGSAGGMQVHGGLRQKAAFV